MNGRVRRVQELRRSNAAQPRPGRRFEGPSASEWSGRCGLCGEECAPCARGECDIFECTCLCS